MTEVDFYNNEDLERGQTPSSTKINDTKEDPSSKKKNHPKYDQEKVLFNFKSQPGLVPDHVDPRYVRNLSSALDRTNSKLELATGPKPTEQSDSDDGCFDRADPVINIKMQLRPGQE